MLTRQKLPVLDREALSTAAVAPRRLRAVRPAGTQPHAIVIATGSEVHVALGAARALAAERVRVRVVSMPSWELFAAQPRGATATSVLPPVRAHPGLGGGRQSDFGWQRWTTDAVNGRRSTTSALRPRGSVCSRSSASPRARDRRYGAPAPGRRPHELANPLVTAGRAGTEPLVRLHHPRPGHLGRARPADRRGRAARHDLQPDHLREGGRRRASSTTRTSAARRSGPERRAKSSSRSPWPTSAPPAIAFGPVYQQHGRRGRPGLARGVAHAGAATPDGTIHEAERLWPAVDRPNAMIKIPGTREGLPAITHCIAAGISVNVTLLFSVERYDEVIEAFLDGLERRLAGSCRSGRSPRWPASS